MKIDGGCHCGKIRYQAEVDPSKVVICHCTHCQTLSGSAFRKVVPNPEGSFRLLCGTPRIYVTTARSGGRRAHAVCPDCATPIYSAPGEGTSKIVSLRVGTITQREELIPSDQSWFRSSRMKKQEKQPNFNATGWVRSVLTRVGSQAMSAAEPVGPQLPVRE
jgi:hypothetical protein